jgi:hypothetical protein
MDNKELRFSEEDEKNIEYHNIKWDSEDKEYYCSASCGNGRQFLQKYEVLYHIKNYEHKENSIYKTFFNNLNSKYFLNYDYSIYRCKECDESYNFDTRDGLEYNLKKIQKHFDTHR